MSEEQRTAEEIKRKHEETQELLKEIAESVEGERQETLSLRIGSKLVTLQVAEEQMLPEAEIEKELKEKYQQKLANIRDAINEKVSEIFTAWETYKENLEEKEEDLQRKLDSANIMPDVTYEHAKQGLSVVKGQSGTQLHWLYRTVYWPKTIDGVPIELSYSKRLITPVCIVITTERDKVTGVVVRKINNLSKFHHYHSMSDDSDCWGESWDGRSRKWETPDDIIKVGREATAILEEINSDSLGEQEPENLPKFRTLRGHTDPQANINDLKISKEDMRSGVSLERQMEETRTVAWDMDSL